MGPMKERGWTAKATWFTALAYLVSWSVAGAVWAAGGSRRSVVATVGSVLFMFGPLVAAVIVARRAGEPIAPAIGLRVRWSRWLLVAWIGPPLLALATLGLMLLLPGFRYTPDMSALVGRLEGFMQPEELARIREQIAHPPAPPLLMAIISALGAGLTVNTFFALGEEAGWRGLLLRELAPLGFWRSSVLTGVLWGLWHAPLILQGHNYPAHPILGVLVMTAFTTLLAPPFAYVRLRARSVLAAAIAHGTLNAGAGMPLMLAAGGDDLTAGLTGATGLAVLFVANLALVAHDRFVADRPVTDVLRHDLGRTD
jgi:membrane protease YdiL (CAAX protease family)